MSSAFETVEKKYEELVSLAERLGHLARSLMGGAARKEETETGASAGAVAEAEESAATAMPVAEAEKSVESNGEAKSEEKKPTQSDLIRQFLKKHHGVRNRDVIESIKREHGIEVNPSLVSYIRNSSATKKAAPKAAPKTARMKLHKVSKKAPGKTEEFRSGSSMIREYLEKNPEATNDEVVGELKKKKVSVRPTLVSSVRAMMKKMGGKTSKMSLKPRKGLPMTALVVKIMEKSSKEGFRLNELSQKAIDSGYEYRGSKGADGVKQNVYQALHALSRQIPHPGYEGKTPVVLHDGMRWKLNPKAKKKIA